MIESKKVADIIFSTRWTMNKVVKQLREDQLSGRSGEGDGDDDRGDPLGSSLLMVMKY